MLVQLRLYARRLLKKHILPTHSCHCRLGQMKSIPHNGLMKLKKLFSLQWFCHEVSDHLISWTILHLYIPFIYSICNEKISNIQCSRLISRALFGPFFPIILHSCYPDTGCFFDRITLFFHEQLCPKHHC